MIISTASSLGGSIETVANRVAIELFESDDYVDELEREISNGKRFPTVTALETWLKRAARRFVRLSERWNWVGPIRGSSSPSGH